MRNAWNAQNLKAQCKTCGKLFYTYRARIADGRAKYCSKACVQKSRSKAFECKNCAATFTIRLSDWKRGRGKYCSHSCAREYMKKENHPSWKGRGEKTCPICGKSMILPLGRLRTRITCSKKCYKIHLSKTTQLANSHLWKGGKSLEPYPAQFNNWTKTQVRERDKNICVLCGNTEEQNKKKMDVHHIDYDKNNLELSNLISLCRSCHRLTNFNRDNWTRYFNERNISQKQSPSLAQKKLSASARL